MQITYLGHSSFKIKTKTAVIVTDPYAKSVGFRFPVTEADIVTYSHAHEDHHDGSGIKNSNAFAVDGPGEYEIKEVMIMGFKTFHDDTGGAQRGVNTVYTFETEELVLGHLGDLGHALSEKQVKLLENVDVLLIPVGGFYTIDPKVACATIRQLEPSIVIPMHYKTSEHASSFDSVAPVEDFLNELGMEPKREDKLIITAPTLPEEMEVVVLSKK